MKKIYNYLIDHIKSDFNIFVYIYTALFLSTCIYLNYKWDFEDSVLDSYFDRPILCVLFYFLFYSLAYYAIIIPSLWINKATHKFKNKDFWIRTLFFLLVLSFTSGYSFKNFISFDNYDEHYFIEKLFFNFEGIFIYFFLFVIFIRLYSKTDANGLYGLNTKKNNLKPYFILLLGMFPIILWASFQDSFIKYYPTFKVEKISEVFGLSKQMMFWIYEFFYSLDFVATELIFRGAMIIGVSTVLGKYSILPMVSVYAFLHFGKPIPETIGSIFGGYILGVLAFRTKNIWGGCLLHIGIALMMDILVLFQK